MRATKIIRGLELLTYTERQGELVLLVFRVLRYLLGGTEETEPASSSRCTDTGQEAIDTSCNLGNSDIREKIVTVRTIRHGNKCLERI